MWPRLGLKHEKPRFLIILATVLVFAIFTLHTNLKFSDITATKSHQTTSQIPQLPHIQKLCRETQWTDGLTLWCHSACGNDGRAFCGGLTNARSRLQTCVRWAIDAGASEVVVPHVVGRRAGLAVDAFGEPFCMDQWIDVPYLEAALGANCPRLKVRLCPTELDPEARVAEGDGLEGGRAWSDLDILGSYKGSFQVMARSVFKDRGIELASISPSEPVILKYGDSYLGWNYSASEELGTIRKELFQAINFHPDFLAVGHDILRSPKLQNGFVAIHFRGEADWPSDWGSVEDQMRLYGDDLERIRNSEEGKGIRDVYVSCGEQEAIERFRLVVKPRGFNVHDKWSLLEGDAEMQARVDALEFDKRAIVDFQLLANAKYFMGVSCHLAPTVRYSLIFVISRLGLCKQL